MFCTNCGTEVSENESSCPNCGNHIRGNGMTQQNNDDGIYQNMGNDNYIAFDVIAGSNPLMNVDNVWGNKSKTVAILLNLFLGGAGIHDFYLGDKIRGFLHLALFVIAKFPVAGKLALAVNAIWVIVELVMICTGKRIPQNNA